MGYFSLACRNFTFFKASVNNVTASRNTSSGAIVVMVNVDDVSQNINVCVHGVKEG